MSSIGSKPVKWRLAVAGITGLLGATLFTGCGCTRYVNAKDERPAAGPSSTSGPLVLDTGIRDDFPALPRLIRVTARVYSGAQPVDEAAFAALHRLGVRTIVSVDGAQPRLELAQRYGLRYVHVPIGYEGISDDAGRQLAAIIHTCSGPYYVHCHHGKHRGPAAAAILCRVDGSADAKSAQRIMRVAGTSDHYTGLWRAVESYNVPSEVDDVPRLVAAAKVKPMVRAMAELDSLCDQLEFALGEARLGEDAISQSLSHDALLMQEALHEMVRQVEAEDDFEEEFLAGLIQAEETAKQLEEQARETKFTLARESLLKLRSDCQRCHKRYRN